MRDNFRVNKFIYSDVGLEAAGEEERLKKNINFVLFFGKRTTTVSDGCDT